jgi:hypothetical protein
VELSFRINTPTIEEGIVRMPVIVKLRIAVFDPGSEVIGEGILRADAKRPTPVRIIEAGSGRPTRYGIGENIVGIEVGERDTACRINQDSIECDAEACAERALHGEINGTGERRAITEGLGSCTINAGAFEVGLKSGNERAKLEVVANMSSANEAVAVRNILERQNRWTSRAGQDVIAVAPGIASLHTDVEPGPGEHRNCRNWNRSNTGRKIGRHGTNGETKECNRGKKNVFHCQDPLTKAAANIPTADSPQWL